MYNNQYYLFLESNQMFKLSLIISAIFIAMPAFSQPINQINQNLSTVVVKSLGGISNNQTSILNKQKINQQTGTSLGKFYKIA